jgi:dihydroorotase
VLAAVAADVLPLGAAVRALTAGPARVLGDAGAGLVPGITVGAAANVVLVDATAQWTVSAAALRSRGRNTPLIGRELPGRVLLTLGDGRIAYRDDAYM